jgi:tRNA(Ile)-lysidine synthase
MGGALYFLKSDLGVDSEWLNNQSLEIHFRRGGERIKLAENRPTRDMKSHYQSLKIPFWVRQKLPLYQLVINSCLLLASVCSPVFAHMGMATNFIRMGRWLI